MRTSCFSPLLLLLITLWFLPLHPVLIISQHNSKVEPIIENGNSYPEIKTISTENGSQVATQDKDVVIEGFGSVEVYDQWIAPPVSGQLPKARYEAGI